MISACFLIRWEEDTVTGRMAAMAGLGAMGVHLVGLVATGVAGLVVDLLATVGVAGLVVAPLVRMAATAGFGGCSQGAS